MINKINLALTKQEFSKAIGLPIWRFDYIAGSIFHLKIGKKHKSTILSKDLKSRIPYSDSEITVVIDGDWELFQKNKSISSSKQRTKSNEEYYKCMYQIVDMLSKKKLSISNLKISNSLAKLSFNSDELIFEIKPNKFGFISIAFFKEKIIYFDSKNKSFVKESKI